MLVFALLVILCACLLWYAIEAASPKEPFGRILKVLLLVGAAYLIASRGGLLG